MVFGGFFFSEDFEVQELYSSLYSLKLQTMVWEKLIPEGELPPARYSHTANVYKSSLYIFGGCSGFSSSSKNLNDVWRIDIESNGNTLVWENISKKISGIPPSARHGHSANLIKRYLVIYGGRNDKKESLSDVNVLDLA